MEKICGRINAVKMSRRSRLKKRSNDMSGKGIFEILPNLCAVALSLVVEALLLIIKVAINFQIVGSNYPILSHTKTDTFNVTYVTVYTKKPTGIILTKTLYMPSE
jgi:hypothetical protein